MEQSVSFKQPVDPRIVRAVDVLSRVWPVDASLMDDISRDVNLSGSRLRHLFRLETGVSITAFMKMQRLHHAKRMLTATFCSVKEVSAAVGAGDVSHFVRDFKTQFGLTPTEFRKRRTRQPPPPIDSMPSQLFAIEARATRRY